MMVISGMINLLRNIGGWSKKRHRNFHRFYLLILLVSKERRLSRPVDEHWYGILDFDNDDQEIGSGADQISPLVGVARTPGPGTVLVPSVQHFVDFGGEDVNTTALRLIGIRSLPLPFRFQLDVIAPIDWENDAIPAEAEPRLGKC